MIRDFFAHPMRIFFLTACACVVLGCASFFTMSDFIGFHKFAFLALVCPLAYAGFLFTAVPDWANFSGDLLRHSVAMFALFVLSLLTLFLGLKFSYFLMGCFWTYLTVFSISLLVRDKNTDNFSIAGVLIAFCALCFGYAISDDERFLSAQIHVNMIAIVIVSYRVSIVMAKEAFKAEALNLGSTKFSRQDMDEAVFAPNFVYKNLAISALCLLTFATLFDASDSIVGLLALGGGFILLARLHEWHYACLLRHHFIVIYYLLALFSGVGYVWFGIDQIFELGFSSRAIHMIAICAVMGVIMLIFNVAGLRHSGQELVFLRRSRLAFALLFGAGFSRSVFANFSQHLYIAIPATLFALAFALWAIDFYAIFKDNEFSDDPE